LRLVVLALQDRLAYAPTFEGALASLFGQESSTLSASETATAAAPETGGSKPAAESVSTLAAQASKDFSDYERLTADGKLTDAGQKLDDLKHVLDRLNSMQK